MLEKRLTEKGQECEDVTLQLRKAREKEERDKHLTTLRDKERDKKKDKAKEQDIHTVGIRVRTLLFLTIGNETLITHFMCYVGR